MYRGVNYNTDSPDFIGNKSGKITSGNEENIGRIDITDLVHQEQNIYYTASFINQETHRVQANYTDNRTVAIVNKPSDYKLALVKVNVDIGAVGMFRSNPAGNPYLAILYYYPDNIWIQVPLFSSHTNEDLVYLFQDFLDLPEGYNDSIQTAFTQLKAAYNVIHGPGTWEADVTKSQSAPFLAYDYGTSLFTMYNTIESDDTNPEAVQVYLQNIMAQRLESLFTDIGNRYGTNNPLANNQGQIRVAANSGPQDINVVSLDPTDPTALNWIKNTQSYLSVERWWDAQRLIVTSSTIGVRSDNIGVSNPTGKPISINAITDIEIFYDTRSNSPATTLRYGPVSEYRIIDILNDSPLTSINFGFYVQTSTGEIRQLTFSPGRGFDLKILFTKSISH